MWKLEKLAELVGGTIQATTDVPIHGAASMSNVQVNEITFVTSQKYLEQFESGPAAAAVVSADLNPSKPCILAENPEAAFAKIVKLFRPPVERVKIGVSPAASVSPTARISDDVCIYPGAVIMDNAEIGSGTVIYPNATVMENCVIGSNVDIFPGATLYENTIVGDRCIIHSGAVLGAYGFGYSSEAGQHKLSSQLGNVVLEADVEIGANTTIDRGSYDATVVGAGTKLDDLVMVGHNTKIGQHNLLCSQVGIAGSCQTGDYVVMGGQVGMADHLNIGNNVSIGAQSGLMHDAKDGEKLFGSPARAAREEMQLIASRAKLPEMRKAIRKLEKQIEKLTELVQPGASADRKDAA